MILNIKGDGGTYLHVTDQLVPSPKLVVRPILAHMHIENKLC